MNQRDEPTEIAQFLNNYKLSILDPQSTVIQSSCALYLSKSVHLQGEQNDIEIVLDTLEQHQTLNQNYLLTLLSYNIHKNHNNENIVRTLYQYAKITLRAEISNRRDMGMYFKEEQLWAIVYSVTRSLEYLQKLGIGYGVLGCQKIFIDKKIKLIDPSAVAQDPLTISPHRLYSPQILKEEAQVDILKSDVFVLGLCILQAALLANLSTGDNPQYDAAKLMVLLEEVESVYAGELSGLLRQMLQSSPRDRPSFSQIREYLQNTLEMTDLSDQYFNPLLPDVQDLQNPIDKCDYTDEIEVYDSEEQEEQCCLASSLNQFEKAKIRFLNEDSGVSQLKELSRIDQNSQCSSTFRFQNTQKRMQRSSMLERGQKGIQESRQSQNLQKKQISKTIKDKLIKDMSSLELQVIEVKQYNKGMQPKSCQRNGYNHLFTNPKLMQQIQNELQNIARNRGYQATKQNIYSGNN